MIPVIAPLAGVFIVFWYGWKAVHFVLQALWEVWRGATQGDRYQGPGLPPLPR